MLHSLINSIKQLWNHLWTRYVLSARTRSSDSARAPVVQLPAPPSGLVEPQLELGTYLDPEYRKRDSLFTYQERVFFRALLEALGGQYSIFAKVRMGDVLFLRNEPENRKYHNNQLQCKHFDFVLCEKGTYQPILVIELDDSSHTKFDNRARDEFKDKVCAQTGLKLWRLRIQREYQKGYIAENVKQHLASDGTIPEVKDYGDTNENDKGI